MWVRVCAGIASVTWYECRLGEGVIPLSGKMLHTQEPNLRRLALIPPAGGNFEFSCYVLITHSADTEYSTQLLFFFQQWTTKNMRKATIMIHFQKAIDESLPEESLPLFRLLHMCSVLVIKSGICPKQLQPGRRYRENERQFINQRWNAASFPPLTPPFQMSSSTDSKAVCITQARLTHHNRGTLHNPDCVVEDKTCVKSSLDNSRAEGSRKI